MKYIFIAAVGLLLIAGCCNSFEKRAASDYLVVTDDASNHAANEAAARYSKVVKFYPTSGLDRIVGGSHMQSAAGEYPESYILFITYKVYDSGHDSTYEFIKDGIVEYQESAHILSKHAIQNLVTEYLE